MSERCKKYESLFVFGTDDELAKHLETCEDCQQENEKMQKVQNLVKEVGSAYKDKKNSKRVLNAHLTKIAAGIAILFLTCFSATYLLINENSGKYELSYNEHESIVSEMGLPTDEYGLFMVY